MRNILKKKTIQLTNIVLYFSLPTTIIYAVKCRAFVTDDDVIICDTSEDSEYARSSECSGSYSAFGLYPYPTVSHFSQMPAVSCGKTFMDHCTF